MVGSEGHKPALALQSRENGKADQDLGDEKSGGTQEPGGEDAFLFVLHGKDCQYSHRKGSAGQQADEDADDCCGGNHNHSPFKSVIQSRISSSTEAFSS